MFRKGFVCTSQTGDYQQKSKRPNLAYQILPFFKGYRLHLRFMKKITSQPHKKTLRGYGPKNKVQPTIFGSIDSILLVVFISKKKNS